MDMEKVRVIQEWEAPTKVTELRSSWGLPIIIEDLWKGIREELSHLPNS